VNYVPNEMKVRPFRLCRCSNYVDFSGAHNDLYSSSLQSLQGSTSTSSSALLHMAIFDTVADDKGICGTFRSKESQCDTHTPDKPKSTLGIRRLLIPVLEGSRAFGKRKCSTRQNGSYQGLLQAMSRGSSAEISMQQSQPEMQLFSSSTDTAGDSGESNGLSYTNELDTREPIGTVRCLVYQNEGLQELGGSVHCDCCSIANGDSTSIMDVDDPTIADILEAVGEYEDPENMRQSLDAIIRTPNDNINQEYAIPDYINRDRLKPFVMPFSFWSKKTGCVGTGRSIISSVDTVSEDSIVALIECESQDSSQKSIHHVRECLIGWEPPSLSNEKKKRKEDKQTAKLSIPHMLIQGSQQHCLEYQIKGNINAEREPLESDACSGPGSFAILSATPSSGYFGSGEVSVMHQGTAKVSPGTPHSMSYSRTVTTEDEQLLQLQPTDLSWLTSAQSPESTMEQNRPFVHISTTRANDVNKEQQGGNVIRKSGHDQPFPHLHKSSRVKEDSAAPSERWSTESLSIVAATMKVFDMESAAYNDQAPTRAPQPRSSFPGHQHSHCSTVSMSRIEFPWHADRPLALCSRKAQQLGKIYGPADESDDDTFGTCKHEMTEVETCCSGVPICPSQNGELMRGTIKDKVVSRPSTTASGDHGWNAVKNTPAQQQFAEMVEWPTNKYPIQQITDRYRRYQNQEIREEPPRDAVAAFESCPSTKTPRNPFRASNLSFFDQQDAQLLHKPMPVRATYDCVSIPVAKEILQGPQGPASLIQNRLTSLNVSTTASIQDRFRQVERLLSKQEHVLSGEEPMSLRRDASCYIEEDGDSDLAQRRGSVQSYWERRIAGSSPIVVPDPSKLVSEPLVGTKSRMVSGDLARGSSATSTEIGGKTGKTIQTKILALEKQFNGVR
jgi:hypothetical protein